MQCAFVRNSQLELSDFMKSGKYGKVEPSNYLYEPYSKEVSVASEMFEFTWS